MVGVGREREVYGCRWCWVGEVRRVGGLWRARGGLDLDGVMWKGERRHVQRKEYVSQTSWKKGRRRHQCITGHRFVRYCLHYL